MIRSFSSKVLAAAAGASMLAMTLAAPAPASAFTLASPDLGHSFAADGHVEKTWWDRWGRWHPNYWGPGYYHPYHPYWGPRWGYGYGWHRRCWRCW